jgi:hypothetical protein
VARCQCAASGSRYADLWYGGTTFLGRAKSASEPSANLAPRLDRREQNLPGVQVHCIIFLGRGKSRVSVVEVGVVFSKAVNGSSVRPIRKHAIAAQSVGERRGVGGASRRGGVTGTVSVAANGTANSSGVIGNGRRPQQSSRQLTPRRCAWVSAQPRPSKIFWNACATGPAATSPLL